jgi:hypothetical protein
MNPSQDYIDLLPQALMRFQWLEEALKGLILRAHIVIACRTQDVLRFDVKEAQIWETPLGKLVHEFDRISKNRPLAERLRGVVKTRNDLAHAGYIIDHYEQVDASKMAQRFAHLQTVHASIQTLFFEVMAEWKQIESALPAVFEDLNKRASQLPDPTTGSVGLVPDVPVEKEKKKA